MIPVEIASVLKLDVDILALNLFQPCCNPTLLRLSPQFLLGVMFCPIFTINTIHTCGGDVDDIGVGKHVSIRLMMCAACDEYINVRVYQDHGSHCIPMSRKQGRVPNVPIPASVGADSEDVGSIRQHSSLGIDLLRDLRQMESSGDLFGILHVSTAIRSDYRTAFPRTAPEVWSLHNVAAHSKLPDVVSQLGGKTEKR